MLEYFLIVFFAWGTAWMYSMSTGKLLSAFFWLMTLFLLAVPAVVRYGIGLDYLGIYVPAIDTIMSGGDVSQEASFRWIVEVCGFFSSEPHLVIAVYSILTYLIVLLALPKDGFHLALASYMLHFYAFTYSGIRQGAALSFVVLATAFALNRRHVLSAVFLVVAMFLHASAIVVLVFWLMAWGCSLRFTASWVKGAVLLVGMAFYVFDFSSVALWVAEQTRYVSYFEGEGLLTSDHVSSGLGYLVPAVMFYFLFVVLFDAAQEKDDRERRICLQIAFLCAISFLLNMTGVHLNELRRVSVISDAILPFAVIRCSRERQMMSPLPNLAFPLCCLCVCFVKEIVTDANYHITPYQTIFDAGISFW